MSDDPKAPAPSTTASSEQAEGPPNLIQHEHRIEIHLNRPSVHNRLEPSDIVLLSEILQTTACRPQVKLVTFHARGASFCSGVNLKALAVGEARPRSVTQALNLFEKLPDMVEALPAPTLFVLNGPVYGGAMDVVLAGCFRIGAASTTFSVAAPGRGALYSPPGIARAVRLLGVAAARRIFILGQTLNAEDLLAAGALERIVSPGGLAGCIAEFEQAIYAKGPLPLRAAKRIINDAARGSFEIEAWQALRDEITRSADLAEGMTAWRDRRPPRFEGR